MTNRKLNSIVWALCLLMLLFGGSVFGETPCTIQITNPTVDGGIITNTGVLAGQNLFTFTVAGTAANVGKGKICLYIQRQDSPPWWRSGKPIQADKIVNGQWKVTTATCGPSTSPHAACSVRAVVQTDCPQSGERVQEIAAFNCSSQTITIKTK